MRPHTPSKRAPAPPSRRCLPCSSRSGAGARGTAAHSLGRFARVPSTLLWLGRGALLAVLALLYGRDERLSRALARAQGSERLAGEVARLHTDVEERVAELSARLPADPRTLYDEILLPSVQLTGERNSGSGTLVASYRDASGQASSYVLTAWHVVRNILAEPLYGEGTPRVKLYPPDGEPTVFPAELIARNERIDAALLRFESPAPFEHVARVWSRADGEPAVWDAVHLVGCPIGSDPLPTSGELASKSSSFGGASYWMINAPAFFGNSGGGVFLARNRRLIGVFARVHTHEDAVIQHMGLMTPVSSIRTWLAGQGLEHVLQAPAPGARLASLRRPEAGRCSSSAGFH